MQITDATEQNFADILALNEKSVPHVNSIGPDQIGWFHRHAAYFRIVRTNGGLAGFLVGLRPGTTYTSLNYRWFCDHYDDFAYIDRVAVAKTARRRGIAQALYEDFAATQNGATVMTCEVNLRPANDVSMRFHQQLGFRQVGSQELDGGNKEVALLEKPL